MFFALRGKSDEVGIFEILGRPGTVDDADRRLCERFAAGLELFEGGNWSEAAECFRQLALDYPADGPAPYLPGPLRPLRGGASPVPVVRSFASTPNIDALTTAARLRIAA